MTGKQRLQAKSPTVQIVIKALMVKQSIEQDLKLSLDDDAQIDALAAEQLDYWEATLNRDGFAVDEEKAAAQIVAIMRTDEELGWSKFLHKLEPIIQ